jgi:integrase
LHRVHGQVAAGLPLGDDRLTVATYLNGWLRDVLPGEVTSNTAANYAWAIRTHINPALGKCQLRKLRPADVASFLRGKVDSGLSHNSVVRLRQVLVKALRHAEREGFVGRNVAALVPAPVGERPIGRSLTVAQARQLLRAVDGDRLEAAYATMLMIGLRPGEALGLAWEDVDLENGVLRVRRALRREGSRLVLVDPKTPRSRRTLALPSPVAEALREHRQHQREERVAAGPNWSDSGLVFTTSRGTPIDPRNFRRSFSRVTMDAGLGRWHPHELRHSAVSLLSAAGVPLEDVADLVGHDSTRMTSGVYRHILTPTVAAAVAPMERLFGTA